MRAFLSIPYGYKKHDSKAPDGCIAEGFRIVKKGGRVKFAGVWWHHEKLKAFEDETVFCQGQDYWQTEMDVSNFCFKHIARVKPIA